MSIFASVLRTAYKLSGAKKAFGLPDEEIRKVIDKQNRNRGVFTPTDRKAHYETVTVHGFPCLIVREHPTPSKRAILYFFGGGMVIGPDKGDLPVMRKLMQDSGCDVWFPFYPLCTDHCITETYDMVYECYRRMIALYGGGVCDQARPHGHHARSLQRGFASMELIHARLVRTTTCANGCKCDYTICGDKDPYLKNHPEYRDKAGYRRNK